MDREGPALKKIKKGVVRTEREIVEAGRRIETQRGVIKIEEEEKKPRDGGAEPSTTAMKASATKPTRISAASLALCDLIPSQQTRPPNSIERRESTVQSSDSQVMFGVVRGIKAAYVRLGEPGGPLLVVVEVAKEGAARDSSVSLARIDADSLFEALKGL